jgi:hypothetical protein
MIFEAGGGGGGGGVGWGGGVSDGSLLHGSRETFFTLLHWLEPDQSVRCERYVPNHPSCRNVPLLRAPSVPE